MTRPAIMDPPRHHHCHPLPPPRPEPTRPTRPARPASFSLAARLLSVSAAKLATSNGSGSSSGASAQHATTVSISRAASHHPTIPLRHRILIARALAWAGRATLGVRDPHRIDAILHPLPPRPMIPAVPTRGTDAIQDYGDTSSSTDAEEDEDDDDSWLLSSDTDDDDDDESLLSDTDVDSRNDGELPASPPPPASVPPLLWSYSHLGLTSSSSSIDANRPWLPSPPPSPPTLKPFVDQDEVGFAPTAAVAPALSLAQPSGSSPAFIGDCAAASLAATVCRTVAR